MGHLYSPSPRLGTSWKGAGWKEWKARGAVNAVFLTCLFAAPMNSQQQWLFLHKTCPGLGLSIFLHIDEDDFMLMTDEGLIRPHLSLKSYRQLMGAGGEEEPYSPGALLWLK